MRTSPAFIYALCCCRRKRAGAAGGNADRAALLAWFTTPAYTEGDDPERKSPTELSEMSTRELAAEQQRSKSAKERKRREQTGEPVYYRAKCNGARDCLSSEGWQPSIYGARFNGQAWVKPDPKRTWEIWSAPDGILLETITNVYGGAVEQRTTDLTELEQRRLAGEDVLRGRL